MPPEMEAEGRKILGEEEASIRRYVKTYKEGTLVDSRWPLILRTPPVRRCN